MNVVGYVANMLAYELLLNVCIVPLLLLVLYVLNALVRGHPLALDVINGVVLIAWVFGGSWVAHIAARKRVLEGERFFQALGSTFWEGQLYLSFVPGVGSLFNKRARNDSPFDETDDQRFQ